MTILGKMENCPVNGGWPSLDFGFWIVGMGGAWYGREITPPVPRFHIWNTRDRMVVLIYQRFPAPCPQKISLRELCNHPVEGGWLSKERWETIIRKVGDNPGKGAASWESWVTIPGIVYDRPVYNGWLSLERWVISKSLHFAFWIVMMGDVI